MTAEPRDWRAWHAAYDEAGSPLETRLGIVQGHIAAWLDGRRGAPVRIVSACAGEGRDLLGVLEARPHDAPLRARLVELDPGNVAVADATVRRVGLAGVEVIQGDAGLLDSYAGAVPADLVLMCGVFGNVPDDDIRTTIRALPQLCARDATVVWTRSRRAPDVTPTIRGWFADAGFVEEAFDAPDGMLISVGVHRFAGQPQPLRPAQRMFAFSG